MADNYTPGERSAARPLGPVKSAKDEGGDVLSDRVTPRVAGADVSGDNPLPVVAGAPTKSETYLSAIMGELRGIRTLLATAYGVAAIFEPLPDFEKDPNAI